MSCRVRQIPAQSRLCQPYAVSFRASCLTSLSLENIHCNTEIILYRLLGCWWEERTWKDQYVYVCTQLSPILCDPTDSSPPGSSVQGFSRQEYWSGLLSPIPGDLPAPGTEPQSPVSSVLADGFFFFFFFYHEATSSITEQVWGYLCWWGEWKIGLLPREVSPIAHTSQFRMSVLITAPCGFPSSQTSWKYVLMDFLSKGCHPLSVRAGIALALLHVLCNIK